MSEQFAAGVSTQLTLFAEAFPVSRTPWLASVPDRATSATCGPTSPDSFASVTPDGSWRKTCQGYSQVTLDGSLEEYCETWPRSGMTLSGTAYRLPHWEHSIDVSASGSWPTPTGRDHKDGSAKSCENVPANGLLGRVIHQWPKPSAGGETGGPHGMCGGSAHRAMLLDVCVDADEAKAMSGGSLNPAWVEILMGYPKGWTEL